MTYKTRWFRILSGTIILALLLANLPLAIVAPQRAFAQTETVFINEIHYDNASSDAGEAIEIAGPAGTDLAGWSLVLYNGSGGAVYRTTALNGTIPDQENGFGTLYFTYPVDGIQNGSPDGIALVDPFNTVVQFLSYEGTFTAVGGAADGMVSTDIGVSESSTTPLGYSLQLTGTGTLYRDFMWFAPAANTFGAINTGQTFEGGVVTPADPVLNEFSASTAGTDVEFVEIYGDPNTDYSAYTLLEIEGDSGAATGTVDEVISIGSTDSNGLWLGSLASNALENGSITLLLVKDFTGALTDDLDADNDGAFDTTPWSAIVDAVAVNDGGAGDLLYGVPTLGVSYDGFSFAPGGASRIPDGFDTDIASDWVRNDFDLAGIPGFPGTPEVGEAINTPGAPNLAYTFSQTDPVINEFVANHVSTDTNEFVEIFGDPSADYSAFTLIQIEGDFASTNNPIGLIDRVWPIGTTDIGGFWWSGFLADALENGSLSLLLVEGFSGAAGNDLDTNDDGILDSAPWTRLVDSVAIFDGGTSDRVYGTTTLASSFDGVSFTPGGASRIPDGFDSDAITDWVRNDFDLAGIPGFGGTIVLGEAYNTPGAPNEIFVPPPEVCGDPFTPIYTVQGSGAASPLVGSEVAVEGIVVGDFQNNASIDNGNLNGFHIQDPLGDGDPASSDGIFIFASDGMDVAIGDAVRVRGAVSEYNGMTEIAASQIWLCASGNSIAPTSISLPVTSLDAFEPYEGMLVTFPQGLVISEYFNFDRFGEIVLTSERHLTPTAQFEPGPEAIAAAQQFLLDRITLDDGRSAQNPDPAIHPNGNIFDLNNLFRGGDMVANVTGVLDYSFGLYRIQPTQGADYFPVNVRPPQPDEVGGYTKVASFNVLNYFTTIDTGAFICGPAGNQECRGADSAEEFTRQRAKIVAAISAIDADVIGLLEIENHPGDVPTADLVNGLNDAVGTGGTYAYIGTGAIGSDAIRTALIYKPGEVTPQGSYAILDSSVDPRFLDNKNRPVLAQTFMDNATGEVFTVAVNHLKSKGSDCNDVGDPDRGDGAGNCNLTRTAAAQALVDWLATDPTDSRDADFLIIGDLNSYDKEDPIDIIREAGYTDLIFQLLGEEAYGYVFDGQTGYLDHALASAGLVGHITGATFWHINADEPDLIDYDMSFKADAQDAIFAPDAYRSSDHDPVIIGICEATPPTLVVELNQTMLWPPNHKYVTIEAYLAATDNADPDPTITLLSVTSNEPDNGLGDGDKPDDIVIIDNDTFKLRAERSGKGNGRIYTITYQVTDDCGNSQIVEATVTVPHGR